MFWSQFMFVRILYQSFDTRKLGCCFVFRCIICWNVLHTGCFLEIGVEIFSVEYMIGFSMVWNELVRIVSSMRVGYMGVNLVVLFYISWLKKISIFKNIFEHSENERTFTLHAIIFFKTLILILGLCLGVKIGGLHF